LIKPYNEPAICSITTKIISTLLILISMWFPYVTISTQLNGFNCWDINMWNSSRIYKSHSSSLPTQNCPVSSSLNLIYVYSSLKKPTTPAPPPHRPKASMLSSNKKKSMYVPNTHEQSCSNNAEYMKLNNWFQKTLSTFVTNHSLKTRRCAAL
jgi:hypothetical protein